VRVETDPSALADDSAPVALDISLQLAVALHDAAPEVAVALDDVPLGVLALQVAVVLASLGVVAL
jgi:hypothetical protein